MNRLSAFRVAMTVGVLLASAAGAAAPAAAAGTPRWRVAKLIGSASHPAYLLSVSAVSANDSWFLGVKCTATCAPLAGQSFMLEHWDGTSFHGLRVPTRLLGKDPHALLTMGASSARNVWLFGDSPPGNVLRFDGSTWHQSALPLWATMRHPLIPLATAVFGPDDVWGFTYRSAALHYARHAWHEVDLPAKAVPTTLSAVSRSDMWMLGYRHPPGRPHVRAYRAMRWNGKSWSAVSMSGLGLAYSARFTIGPIAASGPDNLWVVADKLHAPYLLHWGGASAGWQKIAIPTSTSVINHVAQDGVGGVWLDAILEDNSEVFYHYSAGQWATVPAPTPKGGTDQEIFAMSWVPGTTSVWAAGFVNLTQAFVGHGVILKYGR